MLFVGQSQSLEISAGRWAAMRGEPFRSLRDLPDPLPVHPGELWVCILEREPEFSGSFLEVLRKSPGLACLPHEEMALARRALDAGFRDYLCIPTAESVLFRRLDALHNWKHRQEPVQVRLTDELLQSADILLRKEDLDPRVIAAVETVAPFPTTVLLQGETGSGKEVAARVIHVLSQKARGPFVAVNLAAMPRDLVESELFGHVRGSFTGATQSRKGAFSTARGGTLFLDEIGEAPLEIQVKLLRAIQNREYLPVGAERPERSDCRIIAATHRNLLTEVEAGRFRQDLYYRLSVFPVHLKPLRERIDDLPVLARAIIEKLNNRLGTSVSGIESEAIRRLSEYGWPGNVRELENVLERAMITVRSGRIPPEAISIDAGGSRPSSVSRAVVVEVKDSDLGGTFDLDRALAEFELTVVRRALDLSGGNLSQAARLLGVPRTTLYNRLLRSGVRIDEEPS